MGGRRSGPAHLGLQDRRNDGKVIMPNKTVWIALVTALMLCGCAVQDDVYVLDHRLSALERRNLELEKQTRELEQVKQDLGDVKEVLADRVEGLDKTRRDDEMALRGQYAGVAAQLQSMQEETRQLSGRLEEMEYLVQQKLKGVEEDQLKNRERMDRLAVDMAALHKRMDMMAQHLGQDEPQARKPAAPAAPPPAAAQALSDEALYLEVKKAFDDGDLETARTGFEKLLAAYPQSPYANNAQFWIGETYYREQWYEKAILEYQKVIENYPSGNKIPAALLKQGLAFFNIGETNNARLVLRDLVARYPNTSEADLAKQKLESF